MVELKSSLVWLLKLALGGKTIELPTDSSRATKIQIRDGACDEPIEIAPANSRCTIKMQFCDEAIEIIADQICEALEMGVTIEADQLSTYMEKMEELAIFTRAMSTIVDQVIKKTMELLGIKIGLGDKCGEMTLNGQTLVETLKLQAPIKSLELFDRDEEALKRAGIQTIGELAKLSRLQLWATVGLSASGIWDVVSRLKKEGLELRDSDPTEDLLLETVRAWPIEKLEWDFDHSEAESILKRNGVHLLGDLLNLTTLELLLLDPELDADDINWLIRQRLERFELKLVEDNFFQDENLVGMARDIAIERLFPSGPELQALKSEGIETINQLLDLSMEGLFGLLEDDRDIIWGILQRLKTKRFKLRKTEHILGLSIAEAYQEMPISARTELLLSHEFYVDTVGELICRPQSSFCSKRKRLSQARLRNLRLALLEEGLYMRGDAEWAKKQRAIHSMSLEEVRALPISRLLFEDYAKRAMTTIGIKTVGDLLDYSEEELRQHYDFGDRTMEIVSFHLDYFGLELKES